MKTEKYKAFHPIVTPEQFCSYKNDCPETYTASPIVNAVCEAFETLGLVTCRKVAHYLRLNPHKLSCAIEVATGGTLADLRLKLVCDRIMRCRREHPEWDSEQIAHHLGFYGRSTVWHRIKDDRLPVSYKKTKKMLSRDEVLARMKERLKDLEKIDANSFEKLLDKIEKNI